MRMALMVLLAAGTGLWAVPLLFVSSGSAEQANSQQGSPKQESTQKFRAFLEEDWKLWMVEYPEVATSVGFPGQNARWTDDSPAGIEARKKHLLDSAATLKTISRDALPAH